MKPDLDRQPRRNQRTWPNNIDTPLDRARRIAGMYRARLHALNPEACDDCDQTAADFGETWMLERPDIVEPDRELTTTEAAELVQVSPDLIRKWACQKHPTTPGLNLLPRYGWRGRERTYIAGKVFEAAALARVGQHAS
ncbi:hypothetical protein FHR83_006691 [Actinoplanes campanulatus]|uniref:Helix-turn-helix domain-containing protein n=1 Tax=Actinoplanes campanulatus TaxID=113559 RepID=A0A7W5AMR0_9ACTN|nr:hypothetical protein [Actinoplanes campanulatus]MBB3098985.1 hypothetical protein [Actinoplanes campanulatus]GGN39562.1 hypothetical protein GCM10010109_67650 [Actinoplanes campanulatus]